MHSETDATPSTRRRRWRIVTWIALAALVLVVAVWSIVFRTYVNDGDSMAPTLASGDRVIVNRLASADAGDVVVVTVGEAGGGRQVVKRIVAVGGDTIGYLDCRLVRNGAPVDQPYETIDQPCVADDVPETEVPDGSVFLLGDNRPVSTDSRSFGPVAADAVVGVVIASL